MIWFIAFFTACQSNSKTDDSAEETLKPEGPDIINQHEWRWADLEKDPLADHQPEIIECRSSSVYMEGDQIEVETDLCNYAYIEFSSLKDIEAGETVELLMLHTGLWAPEAAQAHAAFLINDEIFWEDIFPIPSSADFFYSQNQLTKAVKKGDLITLHIHNHGPNDWKLGYFRLKQGQ